MVGLNGCRPESTPEGSVRHRARPVSSNADHAPYACKQDGRGRRKERQLCHYADLFASPAWCSRSPL